MMSSPRKGGMLMFRRVCSGNGRNEKTCLSRFRNGSIWSRNMLTSALRSPPANEMATDGIPSDSPSIAAATVPE